MLGDINLANMFGIQSTTGRNGVRRVFINMFSTVGIAALLAATVGLLQMDLESMNDAKRKSLPILNMVVLVTGLSFVGGAARMAAELEKED